jgi:hypothetical protein
MSCAKDKNQGRIQMSLHSLQLKDSLFNISIHKMMQIENIRICQSYQLCTFRKIHKTSGMKNIQKLLKYKNLS